MDEHAHDLRQTPARVFCVIGVSGAGKTTIGKLLARTLGLPFHDADDIHPEANIRQMQAGIPLEDSDRMPWLESLNRLVHQLLEGKGGVIACSALKASYRAILSRGAEDRCKWILLEGDQQLIDGRLRTRTGHFMPASLLESQFAILEVPDDAIRISIVDTPEEILRKIIQRIENMQIGIAGMGVMGRNLALNFAGRGFQLSLYNRFVPGVEEGVANSWISEHDLLHSAKGFEEIGPFVDSLSRPRTILLLIDAGRPVDNFLHALVPFLHPGDVVIDCGNSYYSDTGRREEQLRKSGIEFLGAGISGGEQGARYGLSIMAGGSRYAFLQAGAALSAVAARDRDGQPCCGYLGPDGAGHFVKMVHNGIEYAEMQLIAEIYVLLRHGYGMDPDEISAVFSDWSHDLHGGYLTEITIRILQKKEAHGWLLDQIADVARSKGTGAWTVQAADALGFPSPVIAAALHARYASAHRPEMPRLSSATHNIGKPDLQILSSAFYLSRMVNHHLGFELIRRASSMYAWELDLSEVARIWTNGCIIRSALMERCRALLPQPLLGRESLQQEILARRETLSYLVTLGAQYHLAMPCHGAALHYLNTILMSQPGANLIQAQRDYFGAHGYERTDDPSGKTYHTQWHANTDFARGDTK